MTTLNTQPAALNPCPLCGSKSGYKLADGSTHRWFALMCAGCGAQVGESRRNYPCTQLVDEANPATNPAASVAWNEAGAYAEGQRLARIAAQIENEKLKSLLARSGVVERKAVADEREACIKLVLAKQDPVEEARAKVASEKAMKSGKNREIIDRLSHEGTVQMLNGVLERLAAELRARAG